MNAGDKPANELLVATRDQPRAHRLPDARFVVPSSEEQEPDDEEPELPALDALLAEPVRPDALAKLNAADEEGDEAFDALDEDVARALAGEPANDADLADFDAPSSAIGVQVELGAPVSEGEIIAAVVSSACDTMAHLARERAMRPMKLRPEAEQRMLARVDGMIALGTASFDALVRSGVDALDLADPWMSWAPAFALGCIDGRESLHAILHLIESQPAEDLERIAIATDALSVAPHPELAKLVKALARSESPAARAVGTDLRARLEGPDPQRLLALLGEPHVALVHAAIRALGRMPEPHDEVVKALVPLIDHPSPTISFAAAKLLLVWGRPHGYDALRRDEQPPFTHIAPGLEILVMAGAADDLRRMEKLLRRVGPSAASLSAIGRFGHPRAWAYLLHMLGQDDHAEAAAGALETIFGALVADEERLSAGAWRSAIASGGFDESVRYRGGAPWSVAAVLAWCGSGEASRLDALRLIDELRVRCRVAQPVDLGGWTPQPERALAAAAGAMQRGAGPRPGAWR